MLGTILMVFAFVFLAISVRWNPPGYNFLSLGMALWCLAVILGGASIHLGR